MFLVALRDIEERLAVGRQDNALTEREEAVDADQRCRVRADDLASRGRSRSNFPHPVSGAKWETLLVASSNTGLPARLLTVPASDGGSCFELHLAQATTSTGCRLNPYTGPALNANITGASPNAFVSGFVQATVTITAYDNGTAIGKAILTGTGS